LPFFLSSISHFFLTRKDRMGIQNIKGSVALVTGSNRGIGRAFVEGLLDKGAKRVYASARNIEKAQALRTVCKEQAHLIIPVQLDITDRSQVLEAAENYPDINILINNAGICCFDRSIEAARAELETNCLGTWAMCEAFAPVLAENGGGAIMNILSAGALVNSPVLGSYCVSKAALHSLTQMFRGLLASQGTLVTGVYAGPTETELMEAVELPKVQPSRIAENALEAIVNGIEDVFPDEHSAQLRDALAADPKAVEKEMGAYI
jgi:NAD(P)-dependent dehydrogenase (short-subunit alcohol dehydrogenase family)